MFEFKFAVRKPPALDNNRLLKMVVNLNFRFYSYKLYNSPFFCISTMILSTVIMNKGNQEQSIGFISSVQCHEGILLENFRANESLESPQYMRYNYSKRECRYHTIQRSSLFSEVDACIRICSPRYLRTGF